ncbi:hypothetical protein QBC46DRAFT_425655 [Diplogelasinospora grovesii]|uniref:Uncharacterized protein n=1 Tax=Diplogelasinospora grovesii TaxID=303347 RepID=A0AAN6NBA8_9PEZI|nr:hypothetical protein QBC46DRAFT_425655 [Diplogelasinospora grovesii]
MAPAGSQQPSLDKANSWPPSPPSSSTPRSIGTLPRNRSESRIRAMIMTGAAAISGSSWHFSRSTINATIPTGVNASIEGEIPNSVKGKSRAQPDNEIKKSSDVHSVAESQTPILRERRSGPLGVLDVSADDRSTLESPSTYSLVLGMSDTEKTRIGHDKPQSEVRSSSLLKPPSTAYRAIPGTRMTGGCLRSDETPWKFSSKGLDTAERMDDPDMSYTMAVLRGEAGAIRPTQSKTEIVVPPEAFPKESRRSAGNTKDKSKQTPATATKRSPDDSDRRLSEQKMEDPELEPLEPDHSTPKPGPKALAEVAASPETITGSETPTPIPSRTARRPAPGTSDIESTLHDPKIHDSGLGPMSSETTDVESQTRATPAEIKKRSKRLRLLAFGWTFVFLLTLTCLGAAIRVMAAETRQFVVGHNMALVAWVSISVALGISACTMTATSIINYRRYRKTHGNGEDWIEMENQPGGNDNDHAPEPAQEISRFARANERFCNFVESRFGSLSDPTQNSQGANDDNKPTATGVENSVFDGTTELGNDTVISTAAAKEDNDDSESRHRLSVPVITVSDHDSQSNNKNRHGAVTRGDTKAKMMPELCEVVMEPYSPLAGKQNGTPPHNRASGDEDERCYFLAPGRAVTEQRGVRSVEIFNGGLTDL